MAEEEEEEERTMGHAFSIHVGGLWEMTGGYHTCPACRVANRDLLDLHY